VMSSFCGLAGVPPQRSKPAAENVRAIGLAMLRALVGGCNLDGRRRG